MSKKPRYIVKWNGLGWAAHDTKVDWNISVHKTHEEAEQACANYELLAQEDDK